MKLRLADLGGTAFPTAEETEKWGKVIRAANIEAE
jgi:hypothetical protein